MDRCNKLFKSTALDIVYSTVGTPWRYFPRIKIVSSMVASLSSAVLVVFDACPVGIDNIEVAL